MLREKDATEVVSYPNVLGGTYNIKYAILFIILLFIFFILGVYVVVLGQSLIGGMIIIVAAILLFMILGNIYVLRPKQAVVIESNLSGKYLGTDFEEGIKVMRPFTSMTRFDMNKRIFTTEKVKVQDATGSPVEVSGVFTWQIIKGTESSGPAALKYDIDDYETAVMQICEGGMRRYVTSKTYEQLKEETPAKLMGKLKSDLQKMGIELLDFGFNNVSYAPEIASAMLQVQQAQAVIDAKRQLATGAVETAMEILEGFRDSDVLADEDKSALVRNVVVSVINSEPAKPVIPL